MKEREHIRMPQCFAAQSERGPAICRIQQRRDPGHARPRTKGMEP